MRIIISPAKQMRVDTDSFACKELPIFVDRTEVLMKLKMNSGERYEYNTTEICT